MFIKLIVLNKENILLKLKIIGTDCSTEDYLKGENPKSKIIEKFIACYDIKYFLKRFFSYVSLQIIIL